MKINKNQMNITFAVVLIGLLSSMVFGQGGQVPATHSTKGADIKG